MLFTGWSDISLKNKIKKEVKTYSSIRKKEWDMSVTEIMGMLYAFSKGTQPSRLGYTVNDTFESAVTKGLHWEICLPNCTRAETERPGWGR